MPDRTNHSDGQLLELIERQTAEYAASQEVLNRFASAVRTSAPLADCAAELHAVLAGFQQTEQLLAMRRSDSSKADGPGEPAVQHAIDRQQRTLEHLIARINEIENEIRDRRKRMTPGLDAAALTRQMQTAYARGSRQA